MTINTTALSRSTIATIVLIDVLTIAGEIFKPFKTLLTNGTGHHWVTKSIASLLFFLLLYAVLTRVHEDTQDAERQTRAVLVTTLVNGLALLAFFVWHFLTES